MGLNNVQMNLSAWLASNPHPNARYSAGAYIYDRWVVESLLGYINAILTHGNWRVAGLGMPPTAVITLGAFYGVSL